MKKYMYATLAVVIGIIATIFGRKLARLNKLEADAKIAHLDAHVQELKDEVSSRSMIASSQLQNLRDKQALLDAAIAKAQGGA